MKSVRVLIADDHEVVRKGVRSVLEAQPGWKVVGEARTGREAVVMAIETRPDVVVLDISMPELNGLEATRQIRSVVPAKILVLTVHGSEQVLSEVLDAGADGYVLKAEAGRTLVEAIRAVLGHREFFSEHAQSGRVHGERPGHAASQKSGALTAREREVLQLLAEGKSNKEVGTALGITTKTAETHRAHIMAKLQAHSMSDLVRYAIRNHIIIEP
jgi:DNA-binding NarL/FixJ family response regulator